MPKNTQVADWMKNLSDLLVEVIDVTSHDNRTATFEVVENSACFKGRRCYIKGTTKYFTLEECEAGIARIIAAGGCVMRTPKV